jgi:hypothetical protein
MGGLTDRLLWRIYWVLFEWNLNAVKWKAVIVGATIWIADTLFFTGLISSIGVGIFLGFIVLAHIVPSIPTAIGAADKANFINLTDEQSVVRRFFALIFSDVTEYIEMLLDYLLGD